MSKTTFSQVQEVFNEKASKIEKEGRSYHYIVNDIHVYTPKMNMGDIIESVQKNGVEEFVKKFEYKTKQQKEENIIKKEVEKQKKKEVKKINKSEVTKLQDEITDVTLQILALKANERKTEKHYALREKLHEIYYKLVDFGVERPIPRKTNEA